MGMFWFGDGFGATDAVLDCIVREGLHGVNVDRVARTLGRSRSSVYETYGGWLGLMQHAHRQVIQAIDGHVDAWRDDHPKLFGDWWASTSHQLRTPRGRAFRGLRGLVAGAGGSEELAIFEVQRMRHLRTWIERMDATLDPVGVGYHLWIYLLSSMPFEPGKLTEQRFRELAWEHIEQRRSPRPVPEPTEARSE